MIKECKKHGLVEFAIRKDTGNWRCRKCIVDAVTKRRRKIKILGVKYKGGCCVRCGYNKCIDALDFHHLKDKKFNISKDGHTRSWEKTKEELDKCILLCANCHREEHSECNSS